MGCDISFNSDSNSVQTKLEPKEQLEIPVKLLLLGDSGVGKSSLMIRFADHEFDYNTISTVGIDFKEKKLEVGGRIIRLQIWDTAGQQRFRTITKSYYRGAQGYILAYDITHKLSFDHIKYWLGEIKTHGREDFYTIIVGNKTDLESERTVTTAEGKKFAAENGIDFVEASAKDGRNVEELFMKSVKGHLARNPLFSDG